MKPFHFFRPVAVVAALSLVFMTDAIAATRQTLRGHVPAITSKLQSIGRLTNSTRLRLSIALPLRNREALTNLLNQLYVPASPDFHRYLTPEQFAERFGPTAKDYQTLIRFAESNGLKVTDTHLNRSLLDVKGTVADIEKVFHVTMRVYKHPSETRTFHAPDAEPSLDLELPILGISGLDNYSLPRPLLKATPAGNVDDPAPNGGSGPNGGYIGNDFRAAYAPGVTLNGTGQSVGLLQFDGFYASDIADYESLAGLPNVPLQTVLLDGFDGVPVTSSGNSEVSMDIELAISMAPGLSKVIVYEAPNNSSYWHDILNRMANDNLAKQLSCSWYQPGAGADMVADQIFQQMAAQGQSFFAASGDADAYTGLIPFPSDSPWITQVGGTTLTTSGAGGSWISETVWNKGNGTGSGGGISTQYSIPSWQQGINMSTSLGSSTMHNIPDIAMVGDNIYVKYNRILSGRFSGTSCSAPLWAGFTALVNQQAIANGRPVLGFINPTLYAIAQTTNYNSTLHDIITGNNTSSGSPNLFYAVPGYDLCTGWGTPAGQGLIDALAPLDPLQISPGTGFASTGLVNGPFTVTEQNFSLTNIAAETLNWTVGNTSTWLTASSSSGTLPGGGAGAVTFSLNYAASNLVAGTYGTTVWFTNLNDGISFARPFTLTVFGPPVITAQPTNHTVPEAAMVTFSVEVVGVLPLSYQWRFAATNLLNETNATLVLTNVTVNQSGLYSVIVTNVLGSATSSNALLTVITNGQPVVVTFDDLSGTAAVPDGYHGLTWSNFWYMDGAHYSTPSGYQVAAVSPNDLVYDAMGYPASMISTGSFNLLSAYLTAAWYDNLQLEAQGYSDGILFYDNIYTLSATAPTLISFNYFGVNQVLLIPSGGTSHAGYGGNGVNFAMDNVTISDVIQYESAPQIIAQPTDQVVIQAATARFSVGVVGSLPLFYQWRKGETCLNDGARIAGAYTPSLVISNALNDDAGVYSVVVTNAFGSVTSVLASLSVPDLPPFIAQQPSSLILSIGQAASFSVVAGGSPTLGYRWRKAGINLNDGSNITGSHTAQVTLNSVAENDVGLYSLILTNSFGSVTSSVASLNIIEPTHFLITGSLTTPRRYHTATLLPNGKVLVTGGFSGNSSWPTSAELYDPAAGTWSLTGEMNTAHEEHTATLLSNGKVLIAGGFPGGNSAELYDPATGAWTLTGAMNGTRYEHTATLLPNRIVLVAGGIQEGLGQISDAELYNPATGEWTAVAHMHITRYSHTATLLSNGQVLVAGGIGGGNSAELYDPAAGTWTLTGAMSTARDHHTATLLPDGTVLVAGGSGGGNSAELYNPATGTWTVTGTMSVARRYHTATSLGNGQVLVVGGADDSYRKLASTEQFFPSAGLWATTAALHNDRFAHTATLLPNGTVLIAGGIGGESSAELYVDPAQTNSTCNPAPSGILAWWPGENSAQDIIGTNNGTLMHGATYSSGKVGQAFYFDGVNDYISLNGGSANLPLGKSPRTVEAWVKTTQTGLGEIFCYGAGSIGQAFDLGVWGSSLFVSSWSFPQYTVSANVNDGAFHHVALAYDGTNASVYCDGSLLDTRAFAINTGSGTANIGARILPEEYFIGTIDELSVYNRALTSGEITAIHLAGSAGKYLVNSSPGRPALIGWPTNGLGMANLPAGLTNAVKIAAGMYHSLALKADGTVVGWGENDFGQTDPPPGLTNVTAMAAGWGTSLALKQGGTLEEWGWDGGYGLKSTAESLTNITAISACWDCLMALKTDGTVCVWGKSTHGETNVPTGLTDVRAIAGGGFHCLALRCDGTVVAWGDNSYSQTNVPAGLCNMAGIAAGGNHSLALRQDGTVVAWGDNSAGQTNVPPDLAEIVAISGGGVHSLALKSNGSPAAWGDNSQGQTSVPASLTNVVAIAAGGYHNLALTGSRAPWTRFKNIGCTTNSQVHFTVSGLCSDVYQVLGSTNLVNWQLLGTMTNGTGAVDFVDPSAASFSQRFYRIMMP